MSKIKFNIDASLVLSTLAAVAVLGCLSTVATAQSRRDNGGSYRQDQQRRDSGTFRQDQPRRDGDNGGYRQERGPSGSVWIETQHSGRRYYHQHPSYYYHPYTGSERRRYYTYQGSEFYIILDTGIRIRL